MNMWAGQFSRYSDWLWAERSTDPISVGGGEIFRTRSHKPWGPNIILYNGYQDFPGVKSGRGMTLTPHKLLMPWSRKSKTITTRPLGRTTSTEPQCLYSTSKSLLPLWAVRLYRPAVPVVYS